MRNPWRRHSSASVRACARTRSSLMPSGISITRAAGSRCSSIRRIASSGSGGSPTTILNVALGSDTQAAIQHQDCSQRGVTDGSLGETL